MFEKVSNSECRMSRYGSFNPNEFNRLSCSNCYKLLVYVFTEFRIAFNVSSEGAFISEDQMILDPTLASDVEIIRPTMDAIQFEKWRDCCKEAEKCCAQVMLNNKPLTCNVHLNQLLKNVHNLIDIFKLLIMLIVPSKLIALHFGMVGRVTVQLKLEQRAR